MAEKALTAVVQKVKGEGVSTRSVDELFKARGMNGLSKGQVAAVRGDRRQEEGLAERPIERNAPSTPPI